MVSEVACLRVMCYSMDVSLYIRVQSGIDCLSVHSQHQRYIRLMSVISYARPSQDAPPFQ